MKMLTNFFSLSTELTVQEMKSTWEAEKAKITKDLKVTQEQALNQAIKDTKKKQWVITYCLVFSLSILSEWTFVL